MSIASMDGTVYQAWLDTVRSRGGRMAIREPDGTKLSFRDLDQAVVEAISGIAKPGHWRDRSVILQMPNGASWLAAFLACQAAGAIVIPIDVDVPSEGVEKLAAALLPHAVWNADGISIRRKATRRQPACLVKLTSGSTGEPKALIFEDEQMLADGRNIIATMDIRPDDINLGLIPLGHSYGLGNLLMPLILQGTAIAVPDGHFPHSIATCIEAAGVTVVPTVPALLRGLLRASVDPDILRRVRLWISAGSRLDPDTAIAFRETTGRFIHNFYGSTETGGIAYDRTGKESLFGRSVGWPLEGIHLTPLPGQRLRVESAAVFCRHNRSRSVSGNGRFTLPDRARILDDGAVALLGRASRMVKIAGKRLNLTEVERELLALSGVRAVYVAHYRDGSGRDRLGAALESSVPVDEIATALRKALPKWKIPSKWMVLDAFPVNARGKPDVRELARLIAGEQR